MKDVSKKNF